MQESRFAALLQLLAHITDVDGDDIVALGFASPDGIQQLLSREDLSRMAEEMLKEVELGGGQDDRARTSPCAVAGGIQDQVGEAKMVGRPGPAKQRSHSCQQLLVGEGFHQVVVGAAVEPPDALLGAAQRREQEDWKLSCRPEAAAHADAVETWEHHVQHNQIRWALASHPESLHAIARELDVVSLGLEYPLQRCGEAAVVFDHQNPGRDHMQRYISRL